MDQVGCIITLISLLVSPLSYILHGWVLSILWRWFAVPQFDLPALGIPSAIGLSIIVGFLTQHIKTDDFSQQTKKSQEDKWTSQIALLAYAFVRPLLALGIGWIVHLFTG